MAEGEEKVKKLLMNIKPIPSKESWDLFYIFSKCEVLCKSYSEWPQFQNVLKIVLTSLPPDGLLESSGVAASPIVILVPGCGNSRLSEHLYDAGFTNITNVDFSSAVVEHMMMRNLRERPLMNWCVMDLTNIRFKNETFDAIVDIGGLDAVVEPNLGYDSGHIYLSEVKRLLKPAGKYVCVTLADSKVLGVLFPRFRCGWKMNYCYGSTSGDFSQNLFMMVAWKLDGSAVSQISLFFQKESHVSWAHAFDQAIEEENKLRKACSGMFDPFIPLEDLKANLTELEPGRRLKLTLGQPGVSHSYYSCILLDAQQDSGPFSEQLLVFIVPNSRHLEWITTSSKEQWQYVEHFKSARLLMVVLGPKNGTVTSADMQKHIFPLVNDVVPGNCDEDQVVFVIANGGIKMKETVHQVTSDLSGLIVVDDLICGEDSRHHHIPDKDSRVRCLTVANMVRSKALLTTEGPNASSGVLKVDHSVLKSTRHTAMISGLLLISVHLKISSSAQALVKRMFIGCIPLFKMNAVVIGLGAGLLPMFMNQLPYFTTEVVEADRVMLDVAREYFDFIEGECLKVHITDGIHFVNEKANCINAEGSGSSKIDILILDVNSSNQKALLASPPRGFVRKSFLSNVRNSLSEDGLIIINMVTRSVVGRRALYARLKEVFANLFSLEIEEDVKNEVIFAFNSDSSIDEAHLSEACSALAKSLEVLNPKWSQSVIDASKSFKPLKE